MSDSDRDWSPIFLSDIGFSCRDGYAFRIYDIEDGKLVGEFDDMIKTETVPVHGCKVLRAQLVKKV